MDHPKELTHISLCAGYGGIDLGLRSALGAVRTVAFSEIESFAAENLVTKIEAGLLDAAPIWTDLKTFPWGTFRGAVDVLSGGFPCQPFSAAGRRRGDDDPRHLWPHIVRGIRELGHPPLVFFENVEGIISSKLTSDEWSDPAGTSVLLHVLRELERLGYEATAGVFSAREVGLPHQRKRVFILGARCDLTHDQREWVSSLLRARGHNVENACDERAPSAREPRVPCAYGSEREGELETEYASSSLDDTRGADVGDARSDSGRSTGAFVHCDGGAVGGRGASVSKERSTPHTHTQPSSRTHRTASPAPRGADVAHTNDTRDTSQGHHVDAHGAESRKGQGGLPLAEPCRHGHARAASPAPRGADQYGWEPPRVTGEGVGDTYRGGGKSDLLPRVSPKEGPQGKADHVTRTNHARRSAEHGQTEPSMGRDTDGAPCRMDYEELCHSVDNRTDELRLLGNGVVPAAAERAFRVLWSRVTHPYNRAKCDS